MKKHLYRKGYELRPTNYPVKWYHYILFFMVIEHLVFYKKHFVDFVDEKGKLTREYIK